MTVASADIWTEVNQRHLLAELARVRAALERHAPQAQGRPPTRPPDVESISPPPALETLCAAFGLSPFERDTLLLCAGIELDAQFGPLCAAVKNDATRSWPTWGVAMAVLPDPHWSALGPAAPLRLWRLIEVGTGKTLTDSPLRIDERVLHYLTGVSHLDERLAGLVEPLRAAGDLVPSHRALAETIASCWSSESGTSALPIVQLCGEDPVGKRILAAAACGALGLRLHRLSATVVPAAPAELETMRRLWQREAALTGSALLLECDDLDPADSARANTVRRLIEQLAGPLIVTARERRHGLPRRAVSFDVRKPTAGEQRLLWQSALGEAATRLDGRLDSLVAQFDLGAQAIQSACAEAIGCDDVESLWDACRRQARPRLDDLAQRIEPVAGWNDLVLPEAQLQTLHEIAVHVRQRGRVYGCWGFAGKCARGLGISALFTGASGTGKTMAAEVLANELRLDLYRIDLSQGVSKYIGETEKNLRRVFDAAEDGGVVLLFDEADALFGKRSEVKDSHDRYANIEVSYLLQRMEAYRGLAILTTNMKQALDTAFLRRIRFVVQFPFPDAVQRAEIWRRIFPSPTPTEGLDPMRLARMNVAGGNIRNIALHAAFLAAEAGGPVRMSHVIRATRSEYAKLEKPLTEAEIGGGG